MPLAGTGPQLGDAIKAAIAAVEDKTDREAVFQAMGTAIIAHLLTNGVNAVAVASVTGVTTGAGVSGPGTGSLV